ncbi:MAG: FAD-binding oxidoreductase [Chitinophagaceae bacterium]|nr:FAD-binding oxidoreductase [Chitinophagaceae bacterium]
MDLKSNEPFWLVKNGLPATYPSLKEDAKCDVLVVGGGITGSLIAHQCVRDGYKTILADKREIANGSSSATTSMLQYEIDTPLHELIGKVGEKGAVASYEACSKSIDQLGKVAQQVRSKAGFRKKDSLYFAALKKDVEGLKKEFDARKKAGFAVKWMEAEDIVKKYDLHETYGGILSKQGGSVDAFMLVHEILAYNQKRGLQVYDRTELTGVKYGSRTNEVALSTGAIIRCKKIVYCVGYESASMIKEKFVDLISTYAIVSEVAPAVSRKYKDVLIWNTADPYVYMRTTDDGRMLIGGEDEEFRNPPKRDALIGKKEQKLLKSFAKYLPGVPFRSDFAWAGTFGETKDGLPYIGEHKAFKNSYFVLGFGGNGITFSVTGMEMVSDWLKGKKHLLTPYFAFGR